MHVISVENALIFIHKLRHFPNTVPPPPLTYTLVPDTIPKFGYSVSDCSERAENHNTIPYMSSFFYKGPLLAVTKENAEVISPATVLSINLYKKYAKQILIEQQTIGPLGLMVRGLKFFT